MQHSPIHTSILKPDFILWVPREYLMFISALPLPCIPFEVTPYGISATIILWGIGAIMSYIDPHMIMVFINSLRIKGTHKHSNHKGNYYVG